MDQLRGEIAIDPADAIVVQGQTGPAELFEHVQQCFALPEGPEKHGHGADIEGLRAEPKEVPDDALHLGHEGPDVFSSDRHRDLEEFFYGPHVRVVVGHGTNIVEPVRVWDDLHVGQTLGQFFDTSMEVAEVRCGLHNPFAVQHKHDPQHAMGTRMLGPHVQEQFLFPLGTGYARLGAKGVFLLLGDFALGGVERGLVQSRDEVELAAPAAPFGGEVFSQRVSLGIILR